MTSATSPDNSAPEGPQVGAHGRVESEVSDADTALALGSGDVRVLGTPRVVALLEAAACAAIAGTLDPDRTTVGTQIEMRHLASSPIGSSVVAEARLEEFDGRSLRFDLVATMGDTTIATGTHRRAVVRREAFGG